MLKARNPWKNKALQDFLILLSGRLAPTVGNLDPGNCREYGHRHAGWFYNIQNSGHLRVFDKRLPVFKKCKIFRHCQYVTLWGNRSMLEHTIARTKHIIPLNRIFIVMARDHLKYSEARRQTKAVLPENLIIQPINRETGPGVLLPLMHLCRRYPHSTVAVFPSDHFIFNETLFLEHLDIAFETLGKCPAQIVFPGAVPTNPEKEYRYILLQRNGSVFWKNFSLELLRNSQGV